MGINPTQPNHKAFTFDGTSSRDYGVYITGEAVFNAPQRDVQMVDIPGRNGAYALDKGNFNNITVKYPASIVADNETDFAEAVSDLRNFLCSKTGYCRLEDEYNPDEYRMAIYKSGLEVSHDMLTAGEFDITFECKPQRWLKSGETVVTLTSGNDITNPTLFPSRPQLQTYGYGNINIGGEDIDVTSVPIGDVIVFGGRVYVQINTATFNIDDTYANNADTITIDKLICNYRFASGAKAILSATVTESGDVNYIEPAIISNKTFSTALGVKSATFSYGTPKTLTGSITMVVDIETYGTETSTVAMSIAYDGSTTFTATFTPSLSPDLYVLAQYPYPYVSVNPVHLNSSQSALGNPMYIDLDTGEAYKIESGTAVSVNDAVSLPPELPTLPSGKTTITFDNTFTKVDIVPRWWKV